MNPDQRSAMQDITTWLLEMGNRRQTLEEMANGLIERLLEAGLPLSVVTTSQQAYQPEVSIRGFRWTRGKGHVIRIFDHVTTDGPAYQDSPLVVSRERNEPVRVRLDVPVDDIPYPACRELAELGNTDYFMKAFPKDAATFISFATDREGGFSETDIECLESLLPVVSIRLELLCARYALSSLLHLYLGGNAAGRVMDGAFRLGGTDSIEAVIWMCDLRGFTSLTERTGPVEVLSSLNKYFSCVVSSVQDHGGEVLKFIGDAVLAIFPVGEDEKAACEQALGAAKQAFKAMDATNVCRSSSGTEELQFGLALHLGQVFYGNIGTRTRLDFTVIGPTVNEVARIESLCSKLGRRLLVSETFASVAASDSLISVGKHSLKGVQDEKELFTIELD